MQPATVMRALINALVASLMLGNGWAKPKVKLLNLMQQPIAYSDAWSWQTKILDHQIRLQERDSDTVGHLIALQHQPVYTLGTATDTSTSGPFSHVSRDGSVLPYDTFEVERAGQATFHGPGQVVMYPILDLHYFERDINHYLRGLEEIVIRTLGRFGIRGARVRELTGVWVAQEMGSHSPLQGSELHTCLDQNYYLQDVHVKKVAAIGIKLRRWVSMHGLSLNIDPDMRYFDNITPCGIDLHGKKVGAMKMWNMEATLDNVGNVLLEEFGNYFDVNLETHHLHGDPTEAMSTYLESLEI